MTFSLGLSVGPKTPVLPLAVSKVCGVLGTPTHALSASRRFGLGGPGSLVFDRRTRKQTCRRARRERNGPRECKIWVQYLPTAFALPLKKQDFGMVRWQLSISLRRLRVHTRGAMSLLALSGPKLMSAFLPLLEE